MQLSTRASWERAAPMVAGLLAGVVGFFLAPSRADGEFFSPSAQVVPVLLLALAVEARLFGSRRRRVDSDVAGRIELLRRILEVGTVAVLIAAEAQALWVIRLDFNSADPWLTVVGLAWGFTAIAAIALAGTGRARVTADIKVVEWGEDEVIVQIGLGNHFGDRSVRPLVNYMFDQDAEVWNTSSQGDVRRDPELRLEAEVVVPGVPTVWCKYASARPELTPGDAELKFYLLSPDLASGG